jgi:hypothetical protein
MLLKENENFFAERDEQISAMATDSRAGIWPEVTVYDWCGEFEAIPEEKDTSAVNTEVSGG